MQFRPDGNLYFLLIYSFYFPFFTQLQTAFIIGTSYAIAKLAPKRDKTEQFKQKLAIRELDNAKKSTT